MLCRPLYRDNEVTMPTSAAETAVRTYLQAVKDPSSLRNDTEIAELETRLEKSEDQLERVLLRQRLLDARAPSVEKHEESFVKHAKVWADDNGVSASAFAAEGVPASVLRRAGFRVRGGRGRATGARRRPAGTRTRVSSDEVRNTIPAKGTFTIRFLEDASGASTGVVRKVVQEELKAARLKEAGPDPDHKGPGRAPVLYRR